MMKNFTTNINLKSVYLVFLILFLHHVNAQNNAVQGDCFTLTAWNGSSWSNGEPGIDKKILIAGNYTSSSNITGCSLTVNNGAQLTITAGTTLTIDNDIIVSNGSRLIIENNANLLQTNSSAINSGNITVLKSSSSLYKLDYTLWSSPVSGQ